MKLKVDHGTLCGSELEVMRPAFAAVGLVTDYGGPHANGVTHMALLGFEDGSYLELIAPLRGGQAEGSPWANLMLGDAGPAAWAVGTADIQADVRRLTSLGVETAGPERGSRRRPDGTLLEWQTASLAPGTPGAMLPFVSQDHTPREWRVQTTASMKGSGLSGIATVVLGVRDLEEAIERYRLAYAWDAPLIEDHAEFGAKIAHFPQTPVMLATPIDEGSWLASRLRKFGEIPATFLLKTADLKQTARKFQLAAEAQWFGGSVAWFDPGKLGGSRLGVMQR
jgi:hypothetical protein